MYGLRDRRGGSCVPVTLALHGTTRRLEQAIRAEVVQSLLIVAAWTSYLMALIAKK